MTAGWRHLAVALGIFLSASALGAGEKKMITILHTNDIHGHIEGWRGWEGELEGKTIGGMDRLATAIKQVRASAGPNVLLLDAGDAIGDTMIADETKGAAVIQLMNALRYDAMTIGNHEPDFTAAGLRKLMAQARFPVLAANVRDRKSGELFAKPYLIRELDGVKVGILGLAYANTPLTTAKKNVAELEFRDIPPIAAEFVDRMRKEGAEIVIALTHYGLGADIKLAQSVPGIDVIIGGHSHNRVQPAIKEGETLIVQAGAHGSDLGRIELTISGGKISQHKSELILLDHEQIAADDEIATLIAEIQAPLQTKLKEPIAEATQPIVRAQTIGGAESRKRDEESPADSLFADLVREGTGSDVAFLPGVGYGVALPPGTITAADLRNLVPHESKVVTMILTGAQIREILEQAIENAYTDDPKRKVGGMIQVSGLAFRYDSKAAPGQRVLSVTVGESALDPKHRYRVATNSMLAAGGHQYATFAKGEKAEERAGQYEMIKAALKERQQIATPPLGRISKAP